MTGSSPEKRTRTSRPKRRTGCITCKRRHIRCDETKPACRTCVESRRVCEGYREPEPHRARPLAEHTGIILRRAQSEPRYGESGSAAAPVVTSQLRASSSHQPVVAAADVLHPLNISQLSSSQPHATASSYSSPVDAPPSTIPASMALMFGTEAERRALDFYLHASASCLGSAWPAARAAFWTQTLPSISFSSAPIRHCVLAIAGWHAQLSSSSEPVVPASFAYTQYAAALQATSATISRVHADGAAALVALMACLLLAICESLQGRTAQLRIHLRHSLDIVRQSPASASPDFALVKFLLARLLLGDIMTMGADSMAAGPAAHAELAQESGFSALTRFAEAADALHVDILRHAWAAETQHPASPGAAASLADRASRTDARLAALTAGLPAADAPAARVLAAEHALAQLTLHGAVHGLEALDAHSARFDAVLDALQDSLPPNTSDTPQAFAVGLGYTPLLFRTALLCRDARTRRRALALLSACAGREGVWRASEAAAAARLVIALEERAAVWDAGRGAAVVPESARVRWVEFGAGDRALDGGEVRLRLFARGADGVLGAWEYTVPLLEGAGE